MIKLRRPQGERPAKMAAIFATDEPGSRPEVSLIIPVFNEAPALPEVGEKTRAVLAEGGRSYEIIFVDDGSTDETAQILEELAANDPQHVGVLTLLRNCGQVAALSAGFAQARGQVVVTMDGDGQMEPADLPRLLAKLAEGYPAASGWRHRRRDGWPRRLCSALANVLLRRLTGVPLADFGCSLKAYCSEVVEAADFGPCHPYNQATLLQLAGRCAQVPVRHYPRPQGPSKWSWWRLLAFNLDNVVSFSTTPFQLMGCGAAALAGLVLLATLVLWRWLPENTPRLRVLGPPVTIFMAAVILGVLSCVGELVIRTYHLLQRRPLYVIKSRQGSISSAAGAESVPAAAREFRI